MGRKSTPIRVGIAAAFLLIGILAGLPRRSGVGGPARDVVGLLARLYRRWAGEASPGESSYSCRKAASGLAMMDWSPRGQTSERRTKRPCDGDFLG